MGVDRSSAGGRCAPQHRERPYVPHGNIRPSEYPSPERVRGDPQGCRGGSTLDSDPTFFLQPSFIPEVSLWVLSCAWGPRVGSRGSVRVSTPRPVRVTSTTPRWSGPESPSTRTLINSKQGLVTPYPGSNFGVETGVIGWRWGWGYRVGYGVVSGDT